MKSFIQFISEASQGNRSVESISQEIDQLHKDYADRNPRPTWDQYKTIEVGAKNSRGKRRSEQEKEIVRHDQYRSALHDWEQTRNRDQAFQSRHTQLQKEHQAALKREDPQFHTRKLVQSHLRNMGFKRQHTSDSGSNYYHHPESRITVRVADHQVPDTQERSHSRARGGFTWADNQHSLDSLESQNNALRWLARLRKAHPAHQPKNRVR